MDGLTLAISQGSLRRGSAAVYLDIDHPEIEEFLEIRKASGDFNRKGLNLHHGINVTDAFMRAVETGSAVRRCAARRPARSLREVDARHALAAHSGKPAADRRALSPVHRHREPRAAEAPARARPEGLDLQPLQRDHAAHRRAITATRSAPRCAAWRRSTSRPGSSGTTSRTSSRTSCACSTTCSPASSRRARQHAAGALFRAARALGRARRHGLPFVPAGAGHPVRERAGEVVELQDLPQDPARRRCRVGARSPRSAAPAPTRWSAA